MEIHLNGSAIGSERDFHHQLESLLDLGPYYGRDTAALRDRLTTDVERPLHVIWTDSDHSRQTLGADLFARLVAVMEDAADQDQRWDLAQRFTYELR